MDKFNSLDDIFNDPEFDEVIKGKVPEKISSANPEIKKFQEINDWIREHNGKEPVKRADRIERALAARLKGIRGDSQKTALLKDYDEFDLLDNVTDEIPVLNSLDDILNDDELFTDLENHHSLFDLSRYSRTVRAADKIGVRKKAKEFDKYDRMFKKVHAEIANGERKILKFGNKNKRINGEYNISPGRFYILKGVMLYVESMGDEWFVTSKSQEKNTKIHVIYENGTESDMLYRSLASSLYSSERTGKMISEKIDDLPLLGEDNPIYQTTGFIYVVKYAGDDSQLSSLENLYKIGYSENVESRLKNTENEATYLYAKVNLIAKFEIQNMSARKVEKYLHDIFADKQLQIDMKAVNGRKVDATEWYIVSFEEIQYEINKLVTNLLD
ncbi:hypothetical protein Hs30E_03570 [Lactococcus hodotermopsidis]|uniref:Bacteriophage T5 Orf172 DNA-binding domain-containing protein n=1 Tax=Pseudolactococcus hodotermopsidis TaxID=2709157 RepID=A0A6A0BAI0_9LACT|nr:GIY-YIG nuclease family protein [Lactococcus hodotermopsidis]GFH41806.1 hypothetical protein Hs30E_03570 [Lactococcus hodotermopsidis]